ncbi:MAG: glycosyltransferase [Chlamydiae bacterium]|nr:glycosyltransferase [Chlamydiota bacterium]
MVFLSVYQNFFSKPYLTIIGVVKMSDGLGRQSVELIDALKDEVSIGFVQTSRPSYKDVPASIKRIIKNSYRPLGHVIVFEECIWSPEKEHYKLLRTPRDDRQIRLAYTMFESSEIPKEWVSILNHYFDAAVVPDNYFVKVYQNSGVTIPIFVLPLGLNLQPLLKEETKVNPHFPIVFGNFGACDIRKNQKLLVEAFYEAFGDTPEVILKINSRYAQEDTAKEIQEYIKKKGIHNVEFTQNCWNNEEYLEAFKTIDCLVAISKGEGFSIQPREAMALGIPCIVSDNTAQHTICRTGLVKTVKASLKEPAMRRWGTILKEPVQYGDEYNCSKEAVVEAFLDVYHNYDTYLAKGEAARQWVRRYDFSEMKPYYLALVKPQEVTLSTKNKITPKGICTNSKELYDKYQRILKKGKG